MKTEQLCINYLEALNTGSLEGVLACFDSDATVVSPLYGERSAADFYTELFADTNRSETTLLNVFSKSNDSNAVALHFRYDWTLKDDNKVTFEVVDVFELNKARSKFKKITIIYNTAPLRPDFDRSRNR